jgi:type II secretory pathway predicted ATPase ExeA
MIKLGVLAALDQRIAVRYQMTGMTPDETTTYISHHLQLAGRATPLFSDDALALIHDFTANDRQQLLRRKGPQDR